MVGALATLGALALLVVFAGGAFLFSGPRGGVLSATATPAGILPPVAPSASPTAEPSPTDEPTPEPTPTAEPTAEPTPEPTPRRTPRPTREPRPTPEPTRTPRPEPTATAQPRASTAAARAVNRFYDAVEAHDWDTAIALWSPRMQEQYPPQEWLIGRFRRTTRIDVTDLRTLAIDRDAGTATVAVSIVEYRTVEPSPRRLTGAWELVRIDGRWLLDQPRF